MAVLRVVVGVTVLLLGFGLWAAALSVDPGGREGGHDVAAARTIVGERSGDLESRFELDRAATEMRDGRGGPSDAIWYLLPIAYAVAGLGMLRLARQFRRAGVVIVPLRR